MVLSSVVKAALQSRYASGMRRQSPETKTPGADRDGESVTVSPPAGYGVDSIKSSLVGSLQSPAKNKFGTFLLFRTLLLKR